MLVFIQIERKAAGIIAPIVITDRMIHAAASLPSKLSINDIKQRGKLESNPSARRQTLYGRNCKVDEKKT